MDKSVSETGVGRAYAFFDCRAPKRDIETELPRIRGVIETPSELVCSLYEISGVRELEAYAGLKSIVEEAKEAGIKYVLEAEHPGATNRQTAGEVVGILNQAYQSHLFEDGESFRGDIFFREKGRYRKYE